MAVPAALATPLLAARWGNRRTYLTAATCVAVSLLPLALVPWWGAAGLGFMAVIAFASVGRPASTVYQMELVAAGWRAPMSGATTMAVGLSWSAVAFGGGYAITALGYHVLFLAGATATALGALLFRAYFRRPRGEYARRPVLVTAAEVAEAPSV